MTLREKFIDAFKSGKRFDIQNAEKIADDYAIEFIKWYFDLTCVHTSLLEEEELLKEFKKQKEL